MKKYLLLLVLLAAFGTAQAQLPEFSLHVKLFVDTSTRMVVFGYDPKASDSMLYNKETWFSNEFPGGEELYPPPPFSDLLDFRMAGNYINRPELAIDQSDGGPIDIRKKPVLDSFLLKYEIDLQFVHGTKDARIEWNPQLIPAKINRITLASYVFPHKIRLDMKNQSSFVFPLKDSGENLYSSMILTLYYNKVELEKAAVISIAGIPDEMVLYPNPMDSRSTLHFMLNEDNHVTLSAYDVTGRKVYERHIDGSKGENAISLTRNDFSSHSGVYLIRLSGSEGSHPFERSNTIIVR